jgi:hypothetical protein
MAGSSYNVAEMMMMMLTTLYWTNTLSLIFIYSFYPDSEPTSLCTYQLILPVEWSSKYLS